MWTVSILGVIHILGTKDKADRLETMLTWVRGSTKQKSWQLLEKTVAIRGTWW